MQVYLFVVALSLLLFLIANAANATSSITMTTTKTIMITESIDSPPIIGAGVAVG